MNKKIKACLLFLITLPLIIIGIILLGYLMIPKPQAEMYYKLITDSDGIKWQYGYDASKKELEVFYFLS